MSRRALRLALALAIAGSACRSPGAPSPVGMPALLELSPAAVPQGSGPHSITLRGARFRSSSQVRIGDTDVPTEFIDAQTLRIELAASWTSEPNALPIVVWNSNDASSGVRLLRVGTPELPGWSLRSVPRPGGTWDVSITPAGDVLVGGISSGRLTTLDPLTGGPRDSVETARWPYDVAVDRAAGLGYTAGLDAGRVDVIDLADLSVKASHALPSRPIRVTLSLDGSRLFATTLSDLSLVALDTESGSLQPDVLNLDGIGNGLALTPDGATLWVTITDGQVFLVDPVSLTTRKSLSVGGVPQDVVVDAAGKRAYVANEAGWIGVYDASSGARLGRISVPAPFGLALQPGADRLWVASARDGSVYIIDLTAGLIAGALSVGGAPRTIAFDASGRAFVANESGAVHILTPDP